MNAVLVRRTAAALLVCAMFAVALVAQPGLAAPPPDKPANGPKTPPGQAAKDPPAAAPSSAPATGAEAPAPPAAKRPHPAGADGKSPGDGKESPGAGGTSSGARQTPKSQDPAPQPATAPEPAPPPELAPAPATGAKGSAPSASRVGVAPAHPQRPSGTPAASDDSNTRAGRTTGTPAAIAQPAPKSTSAATQALTTSATQAPAASATQAAASAAETAAAAAAETAAASRRDAGSTSRRSSAREAAARRQRIFYERRNLLLGIEDSSATPSSTPPSALLGTSQVAGQAVALGLRQLGEGSSAELPGAAPRDERFQGQSRISRTFNDVIEVVPGWVWIVLGVLGTLVLALGAHTIFATARTRRLERHRAKLMEDVGLLQEALLPAVPARIGRVSTSVAYRPADGLAAGGDFYDAFALAGGCVGLLLGDVSGHGREALAKTALVRFTVRAHLEAGMSPREALSIAGRSLEGRLGDDFATVIAAIHDPDAGTLTYSSAGHPPPLVVGPPAHAPLTAASAPPIDAGFPTGHRQTVLPMPEGTTVALYSDGLTEARIDGEAIGPERLTEWLAALGPDGTAKRLVELVVERADGVRDDLAAVILHAELGATATGTRIEQLKLDVLDADGPDLDAFLQAAGVSRAERRLVGRRVSEELAVTGGVIVEVRAGEHPQVDVAPIGGALRPARSRTRAR